MTVYVLEAYNTDSRYPDDVRWREYTNSKKRAELFNKIPKIQFSDSGHGVVFWAREHKGKRKETRHELHSYINEQMLKLNPPKDAKPKTHTYSYEDINAIFNEHGMACLLASLLGNPTLYSDQKFQGALAFAIKFIKTAYHFENCFKEVKHDPLK
jgi:hypothetical protein